ncbi:MAG: hypothetical protein ATN36_08210 [Epulopiscium sp. Nele67-Bin005]|nr:MAG: hypothetical protein ATN36_08210 [Epulopiscium sp. Nele67-Bin005]
MNKDKLQEFFKNYGFYLAVGTISLGAIATVFLMPDSSGSMQPEPYEVSEPVSSEAIFTEPSFSYDYSYDYYLNDFSDIDPDDFFSEIYENEFEDSMEAIVSEDAGVEDVFISTDDDEEELVAAMSEQISSSNDVEETEIDEIETEDATNEVADDTTVANDEASSDDEAYVDATAEVEGENFSSTSSQDISPFFDDEDMFSWPIDGNIIVPYRDNNTAHWFSEGLSQTMRTFGICIDGEVGEAVTAPADGVVVDITKDFTSISTLINVGNIGEVMVIDHGNGYESIYGFQNGVINSDLLGQVVQTGDTLGTIGTGTGPFVSEGSNIYLQVRHNGEVVNPEEFLISK